MAAIALEEEHHVDQVLEHARAGERALLRDVADQHERRRRAPSRWPRAAPRTRAPAPTEPGADSTRSVRSVWIESTSTSAGDVSRHGSASASTRVSASSAQVARASPAGARRAGGSARALSSPRDVEHAAPEALRGSPRAAARASTCRCRARRRAGRPSRARGRRRARDRVRRSRSRGAARRRRRRRAARPAWPRPSSAAARRSRTRRARGGRRLGLLDQGGPGAALGQRPSQRGCWAPHSVQA